MSKQDTRSPAPPWTPPSGFSNVREISSGESKAVGGGRAGLAAPGTRLSSRSLRWRQCLHEPAEGAHAQRKPGCTATLPAGVRMQASEHCPTIPPRLKFPDGLMKALQVPHRREVTVL